MPGRFDYGDVANPQGAGMANAFAECKQLGAFMMGLKATEGNSRTVTFGGGKPGGRDGYMPRWRPIIEGMFDYTLLYHYVWNSSPKSQIDNFEDYIGSLHANQCAMTDCEEPGVSDDSFVNTSIEMWERFDGRMLFYGGRDLIRRVQSRLPADMKFVLAWYDDDWPRIAGWLGSHGVSESDIVIWQWGGGRQGQYLSTLGKRIDANEVRDINAVRKVCGVKPSPPVVVPDPPTPPAVVEEDEMYVIHVPTYQGRPCGARLAGPMYKTAKGYVAGPCSWLTADNYGAHLNLGVQERWLDVSDLKGVVLLGALPPDHEAFGDWTADNFAQVIA